MNTTIVNRQVKPIDSIIFSIKPVAERRKLVFRKKKKITVVEDYIQTIEKRIELVNKDFLQKKLLYKFALCEFDGQFLLYMVINNDKGDVVMCYTREVTRDNFKKILDEMFLGTGFMFDS